MRTFTAPTHNHASIPHLRVLLVEDNVVNQYLAQTMMARLGCSVTTVSSGTEALTFLLEQSGTDVVLMDCMMPGMDGFETTRQLRALQKSGEIMPMPVIALTAMAMEDDRKRCLTAGMDDYLTKPLRKNDLEAMLVKWADKRAAAANDEGHASRSRLPAKECLDMRDVDEIRAALGEKFSMIVDLYLTDARLQLQSLEQGIKLKQDPQSIIIAAHSLHASSAHMGAAALAELAAGLESAARSNMALEENEDLLIFVNRMQKTFIDTEQKLVLLTHEETGKILAGS